MERVISGVGLMAMIGIAWLMSSHKRLIPWRIIFGGLALQFAFAVLILGTYQGQMVFAFIGDLFQAIIESTEAGTRFMFNINPRPEDDPLPPAYSIWRTFAFGVLPTIIFFSALMSVLYHWGFMQRLVQAVAWVMQRTLGTSGAETLSTAANIFVGQTEAPLVVRPYVAEMTVSELNVVMIGGFATIAGGVLAMFVAMGIDAGHLVTASVISAPAALLVSKVMLPETECAKTAGHVRITIERENVNVIEAAAEGATTGMKLAINVAAMLIAFVAIIALINLGVGWFGGLFGFTGDAAWTLEKLFGLFFAPLAWLMGIPWHECGTAGGMLGTRTVLNEVLAYDQLRSAEVAEQLSPRSVVILTYALCGFANFASIGIQIGGIGGLAPNRRADLARLGLRAMIGGTLASFMTACVAGILI
jgi:CNT family concentrative nucleoside transporter